MAGADSRITSTSDSLASIGEDVAITVGALSVSSVHAQNFDSSADSVSFGLLTGSGAGATNSMTTSANVDIGVGTGLPTTVTADAILIKAVNVFSKDAFANSNNLNSGSASLGGLNVLASGTHANPSATSTIPTASTTRTKPSIACPSAAPALNAPGALPPETPATTGRRPARSHRPGRETPDATARRTPSPRR